MVSKLILSCLISQFQFQSVLMAMPTSSDWPSPCIRCKNTRQKFASNSKTTLPFLSPLSSTSRLLVISHSSGCPSPILEDKSPVLELGLNLQEFQTSPKPNTEDSNGFICTMFKDPKTQELALEFYEKAKERPDFRPQKSTLKHLIRYLIRLKNWDSIWSLCKDFEKFHVFLDSSTCCRLISSCIKARKFKLVNKLLHVFKADEQIVVLAFETAMKGHNKLHMYSTTIVMYENMKFAGIVLDPGCYCQIIESYLKIGQNEKVITLFKEFVMRVDWTLFLPRIYQILCESLGKYGRPFEALVFCRDMTKKGFSEDPSFYSSLICSFANIRQVKMAELLLEEAESKKMLRDRATYLKLTLMYVELGMMEKTLDVTAVMKRMNVRVSDCIFCAVVNGFSKKRGLTAAIKVYEELIMEGCEQGQVTYALILNVYFRL